MDGSVAGVRWVLAVAVAVVALSAPLAAKSPAPADAPCRDAEAWFDVPGQGLSCAIDGGWLVKLDDGTELTTHGPDPLPPPPSEAEPFTHSAPPACVANPSTSPHNVLVYARAANRPDNSAAYASQLRGLVAQANGKLQHEAVELGAQANYRFRCSAGQVEVVVATLDTLYHLASFSSIVSDLQDLGFTSPLAKHWVWYDGQVPACGGCGGQGNIWSDARLDPNNRHASGPDYALTYGYMDWGVMMHESGHNLGAVQLNAPRTSGAWHCNDGQDVMCYADGGSQSQYSPGVCASSHFDCGHNDYFHVNPASPSYLWSSWNLGSPLNPFVDWGATACTFVRSGTLTAAAPLGAGMEGFSQRTELNVPPSCENRRFLLRGALTVGGVGLSAASNFDLCWQDAANQPLTCSTNVGTDTGVVPAGARSARVFLQTGASSTYTLFVS